ncbi:MAG: DUF4249 domain-containing protein [Thermoanaerobaculia bacterium]|nr:DUF4249 domain-containing protein [Thermoanaerobaculia bacterium]
MKSLRYIFFFFATLVALAACNLEKEVDIELPPYDRQPVVECYLEPGKPFRLLLTSSFSFFDPFGLDSNFLQKTLLQGATVTISYDNQVVTLNNIPALETNPFKIFNYTSQQIVPATPGIEYTLNITLPDGKTVSGKSTMLPLVPIDSIRVEWNTDKDTLARMLTYITDDQSQENYYRRLLNYSSLDSVPDQDFLVSDRISTTKLIAFGTGYELAVGDTVFNSIFHISRDYYNYIESVQLAVFGNLNPFAQPSPIKSNVSGTGNPLGIFTCLVYDRDTTVIMR